MLTTPLRSENSPPSAVSSSGTVLRIKVARKAALRNCKKNSIRYLPGPCLFGSCLRLFGSCLRLA